MRRITAATALASILAAFGCTRTTPEPAPAPVASRPSVILITIDTLRPDHLSGYGYMRPTAPFLESVSEGGVTFLDAWAPTSWTAPSVASLMTSVYPSRHGVEEGLIEWHTPLASDDAGATPTHATARRPERRIVKQAVLDDKRFVTLAEQFQRAGYTTFGVVCNEHLTRALGFGQGFDFYDDSLGFAPARKVVPIIKRWQPHLEKARPFFVWLHLFDPHWPYYPNQPLVDSWTPGYTGQDEELFRYPLNMATAKTLGITRGSAVLKRLIALYDGEIAYTDTQLKTLLTMLGWKPTQDIVVVTSDHGEEFLEHETLGHGHQLTPETLRIPLIIRMPGRAPERMTSTRTVETPVSLLDVYPTLLDAIGVTPPRQIEGASLLPLVTDSGDIPQRPLFGELTRALVLRSVYAPPRFYLQDRTRNKEALYRLDRDPLAAHNVIALEAAELPGLRTLLLRHDARRVSAAPRYITRELDAESVEELRALGYLQ